MEKKTSQSSREPELTFSPITDGLGFHPFSDGLPYAPVVKTAKPPSSNVSRADRVAAANASVAGSAASTASARASLGQSMGSGAVSAGPATFASSISRISVPVAAPQLPRSPHPHNPHISPRQDREKEREFAPVTLDIQHSLGFTYLLRRVLAYGLDSAINVTLCIMALSAVLWRQDMSFDSLTNPGVFLLSLLFLISFNWALITAQEVAFGTSLGKRAFRLALQGGPAAIFLRAFFFLPSIGFCGLGLLWAVFDHKRRCWHDVVVDLQPVEIAHL